MKTGEIGQTQRMTAAEYRSCVPAKRNKYSAKRTIVDGVSFASKAEAARYGRLTLMQRAGTIHGLRLQPRYVLVIDGVEVGVYTGDFSYWETDGDGREIVEDVKGVMTEAASLRIRVFRALHPGVEVRIIGARPRPNA